MKPTTNDYFRQHWAKVVLFVCFTAAVSFLHRLKAFSSNGSLIPKASKKPSVTWRWYSSLPLPVGFSSA